MMFNNETLLDSIVDKWSKSELTNESLSGLGFMGQPSGPTVCSADSVKVNISSITLPLSLTFLLAGHHGARSSGDGD